MKKKLISSYVTIEELTPQLKDAMYALFSKHYDCVDRKRFEKDLSDKDGAIMLFDHSDQLQGFSTMLWDPVPMEQCEVVFSGDTIIHPDYWGSRELIYHFCWLCGQRSRRSCKQLHWFLISKGHRTYQFLPLFSKQWFPSPNLVDESSARLVAKCAEEMFGNAWKPDEGVLRFASSLGQLNEDMALATDLRKGNRYVQFFVEKNPNYASGEELVCLVKMALDNLRGTAKRAFEEGWNA